MRKLTLTAIACTTGSSVRPSGRITGNREVGNSLGLFRTPQPTRLRGRSSSAQELLAKQVSKYDDAELCKLLLEISLSDSAYQRGIARRDDVLMDPAKRYRVDKLHKTVAKELATKREKKTNRPKTRKTPACIHTFLIYGRELIRAPPFFVRSQDLTGSELGSLPVTQTCDRATRRLRKPTADSFRWRHNRGSCNG